MRYVSDQRHGVKSMFELILPSTRGLSAMDRHDNTMYPPTAHLRNEYIPEGSRMLAVDDLPQSHSAISGTTVKEAFNEKEQRSLSGMKGRCSIFGRQNAKLQSKSSHCGSFCGQCDMKISMIVAAIEFSHFSST